MTYDLAALDTGKSAEEGVWMELEHPATNEPLGMKLKVLGVDSEQYQKALRKQQDRRLKRGMRKVKSAELENEGIELLAQCVTEWEGFTYNKKELECNLENVRWFLKTYKWAKDQIDDFIGDRSNFLPA
jgi:uncharacterized protein YbcI